MMATEHTPSHCPICGFEGDQRTVYRHLQTTHRKSEICRQLLEQQPTEGDWVGKAYLQGAADD